MKTPEGKRGDPVTLPGGILTPQSKASWSMSCATHSEEEAGGGCPVVGQVEFDLEQFF
jgi:hypothetical protein